MDFNLLLNNYKSYRVRYFLCKISTKLTFMISNTAKVPETLLPADISKPTYSDFFYKNQTQLTDTSREYLLQYLLDYSCVETCVRRNVLENQNKYLISNIFFLQSCCSKDNYKKSLMPGNMPWLPDCDVKHRCYCLRKSKR
jgi:hypothetical protein